jgi:hypothetical protein
MAGSRIRLKPLLATLLFSKHRDEQDASVRSQDRCDQAPVDGTHAEEAESEQGASLAERSASGGAACAINEHYSERDACCLQARRG